MNGKGSIFTTATVDVQRGREEKLVWRGGKRKERGDRERKNPLWLTSLQHEKQFTRRGYFSGDSRGGGRGDRVKLTNQEGRDGGETKKERARGRAAHRSRGEGAVSTEPRLHPVQSPGGLPGAAGGSTTTNQQEGQPASQNLQNTKQRTCQKAGIYS